MKKIAAFVISLFCSCGVPAMASPIGGSQVVEEVVSPKTTDVYKLYIRGGERTHFAVRASSVTDIDCAVYNSDGEILAADVDDTSVCLIELYSPFAQEVRLAVTNLGDVPNAYVAGVR